MAGTRPRRRDRAAPHRRRRRRRDPHHHGANLDPCLGPHAARALAIPVLQAEILSEHGEDELAGRRIDYLLAATPNDVYNSLVCAKLAPELGRARVFQMLPSNGDTDIWASLGREWRGQVLGSPPLAFVSARRQFRQGRRFTLRTFTEADIAAREDPTTDVAVRVEDAATALLFLRRNGDLAFASAEAPDFVPAAGDRALLLAEATSDIDDDGADTIEAAPPASVVG